MRRWHSLWTPFFYPQMSTLKLIVSAQSKLPPVLNFFFLHFFRFLLNYKTLQGHKIVGMTIKSRARCCEWGCMIWRMVIASLTLLGLRALCNLLWPAKEYLKRRDTLLVLSSFPDIIGIVEGLSTSPRDGVWAFQRFSSIFIWNLNRSRQWKYDFFVCFNDRWSQTRA